MTNADSEERAASSGPDSFAAAVTRYAVAKPSVAFAVALLATAALAFALRFASKSGALPFFSFERRAELRLGDIPPVEEAFFAVSGEDPATVEKALELIADGIERASGSLELTRWGLDAESLSNKRLYLLSNDDTLNLSCDLEAARELIDGNWDYLAADAFLNRFGKRMRSEATRDRFYAVDEALPFVRALAATVDRRDAGTPSPIAPGVVGRAKFELGPRYKLDSENGRGVAAAAIKPDAAESAADALVAVAREVKGAFPDLTVDLDSPRVEAKIRAERAALLWKRAALFALAAAFLAGALIFGGLKASAVAVAVASAAGLWTAGLASFFSPADSQARMFAAALAVGFVYYWTSVFLTRYGEERRSGVPASSALIATSDALGERLFFCALAVAASALAFLLPSNSECRRFGLAVALGLPVSTTLAAFATPALALFSEGGSKRSFVSPARLDDAARFFRKLRKPVLTLGFAAALALAYGARRAAFDDDRAAFTPAIDAQTAPIELRGDRVAQTVGKRALYAVSFPETPEEFAAFQARFADEQTFRVDELANLMPDASPDRRRAVELVSDMTRSLPLELGEPKIPPQSAVVDALMRLAEAVECGGCVSVDEASRLELLDAVKRAEKLVEELRPAEYAARIDAFQAWTSVEALKRLFALRALANRDAPKMTELSPAIRARYFADKTERPAIFVYSTADLRSGSALRAFAANVRAVDSGARGPALLEADAWQSSQKDAVLGAFLAFAAFLFLLALRYRSFGEVLGAAIPGAVCALAAVGAAGWFRIPMNLPALAFLVAAAALAICSKVRGEEETDARADAAVAAAIPYLAAFLFMAFDAPGWLACARISACAFIAWTLLALVRVERDPEPDSENE